MFIIKWLLSQSDLFLNRVKGRVSFLWRCKPSPFEPYWLSTWVVHWIHKDRRKTCTHTANFHSTPRHFIYSLAQLMHSSHFKGVINHSAVTYADQMLLLFFIWLLFNSHFCIITEISVSYIYSDVKVLASSLWFLKRCLVNALSWSCI